MVEAEQSFEMEFAHVFIKPVCFCLLMKEITFICQTPALLTQANLNSRGNALALIVALLQNAVCSKPWDMQQASICVAMAIGT